MRAIRIAFLSLALAATAAAQQQLDNTTVVKMSKAGLSPEIVAASVNGQPGHYDISPDALIALKKAGVGDVVISAMIAHNGGGASAPGPANGNSGWGAVAPGAPAAGVNGLPPGVDTIGLYYRGQDGNWAEVGAEVVNFKTGGALKHLGSAGIVKEDLNGHVSGYHSHLSLPTPAEFLLYVPEGTSPGEYQLIRFRVAGDSREFRAITGGAIHSSGGAVRDTIDFTSKKIAPRLYSITISGDSGKGEFGFLPPQETGSGKGVASTGKIYTFSFGG